MKRVVKREARRNEAFIVLTTGVKKGKVERDVCFFLLNKEYVFILFSGPLKAHPHNGALTKKIDE